MYFYDIILMWYYFFFSMSAIDDIQDQLKTIQRWHIVIQVMIYCDKNTSVSWTAREITN